MKKISVTFILIIIILLACVSSIYAQEDDSFNRIQLGLRGTMEFSLLTYLASPSGDVSTNCGPKGDFGLTGYFYLNSDIAIGIDLNYMAGGLFNFHVGYKQDFMKGPIILGMNITAGYDLFVDKDLDTGHGYGFQATFLGGYKLFKWLEIGADLGLNFGMVFSDVNGEPVTITFLMMPIRLYVGFSF